MKTLRDQLFLQYASLGLSQLISDFRKEYEPKKGDRFNYQGITYEIGPAQFEEGGISFELSSKIPQEELVNQKEDLVVYYERVKAHLLQSPKTELVAIERENIVREISRDETKERDYVKVKYRYTGAQLYNDAEIQKKLEVLRQNPSAFSVPQIPGVNTLAGRLVLLSVQQNIYALARQNMQDLMQVNEVVREEFRAEGRVKELPVGMEN